MMKVRLGSIEIGLGVYLALWSAVVLVFVVQGIVHDALLAGWVWSPFAYLRWSMIQWYTWAALAPMVFKFSARYPIQPPARWRALAVHLPASVGVTLLAVLAGACVSSLVEESSLFEQVGQYIGKYVAIGLLTYWTLVAIEHALRLQAEKARRELEASRLATELAQSRLQVLKTQLQPHFLFNTLHATPTPAAQFEFGLSAGGDTRLLSRTVPPAGSGLAPTVQQLAFAARPTVSTQVKLRW